MNRTISLPDQDTSRFHGMNILSVKQFSRQDLNMIFDVTRNIRIMVEREGSLDVLKGKLLANLFYEPSTRTSSSFAAAIQRLGGNVIQINNVTFSSVSKGEELRDTIRTMRSYADAIVLRHPDEGSAARLAELPLSGARALAPDRCLRRGLRISPDCRFEWRPRACAESSHHSA